MKELVLDLVTSYENRISRVEELVTIAYQATAASEGQFGDLEKERERLKADLKMTLANNCSLRRKDFDHLMEDVLSDSAGKREGIEEERKRVIEGVKGYLDEQKRLAASLKQQLVELEQEKEAKDGLDAIISNIKAAYQDTGQQLFAMLRDFQSHLVAFQREQEEINRKLQQLANRGESLKAEDLRQIEAASARRHREAERKLRRQEIERLLAHFKQHRESSRHWQR